MIVSNFGSLMAANNELRPGEVKIKKIFWSIVGIILAFWLYLSQFLTLPLEDESTSFLWSSWQSKGMLVYKDFFAFVFPLSIWIGAIFIKWFGPTVLGLRILGWLLLSGCAIALFQCGQKFLKPGLKLFFLVFMWLIIIPNCSYFFHHLFSSAFATLAAVMILRYIYYAGSKWLLFAGILAGLTILTTQHTGVILFGAILLYLCLSTRHKSEKSNLSKSPDLAWFALPAVFTVMLGLSVLFAQEGSQSFIADCFTWVHKNYAKTTSFAYFSTGFPDILGKVLSRTATGWTPNWFGFTWAIQNILIGWLPILGILWAGEKLIRLKYKFDRPHYQALLFLCIHAAAMTFSTLSYSFTVLLALVSWTGYLLGFMAIQDLIKNYTIVFKKVLAGITIIFFLSIAYLMNNLTTQALTNPHLRIPSYGTKESSYVYFDGSEVVLGLAALTEIIRQDVRADQKLFVFNVCPILYILSDRLPASPYLWVLPGYLSDSQRHEIHRSLLEEKPPIIVYDNLEQAILQTDSRYKALGQKKARLTEIYDILKQYYIAVPINEKFTVYRLKSAVRH